MSVDTALAQNADSPAPTEVLASLRVITVSYFGFDGHVHQGQIVMHAELQDDIVAFFDMALAMQFPIQKVIPISALLYMWNDETSCADNNTSGYNYRLIAGRNKLSKHALGRAFDINPVQNIFLKYENLVETFRFPQDGVYNIEAKGTLTSNHPLVVLLKSRGWEWGGDWTIESGRIDYQHFEK